MAAHTPELTPQELQEWQQALARLQELDLFRRGSLIHRSFACGKPNCRCHLDPPQLHGPYWQWTRKVKGKTVSARGLSNQQVRLLQIWMENARHLDQLLVDLDQLSIRISDRILNSAAEAS